MFIHRCLFLLLLVQQAQGLAILGPILSNSKLRFKLTKRVNEMIDIPFIEEDFEAVFIRRGIDACLDKLLEKAGYDVDGDDEEEEGQARELDFGEILDDEVDQEDEATVKEILVAKMNEGIDIPGLNEDQEAKMIQSVADALYSLKGESFDPNDGDDEL